VAICALAVAVPVTLTLMCREVAICLFDRGGGGQLQLVDLLDDGADLPDGLDGVGRGLLDGVDLLADLLRRAGGL
jgi:hypothetical protein